MTTERLAVLAVAAWRRAVHDLYAAVRAEAEPSRAHTIWVAGRSRMFADHPASARQGRQGRQRLLHATYDPAYRFVVPIEIAEPQTWAPPTGTDGDVPFSRVGQVSLPGLGRLDLWWLDSYGNGLFLPFRDTTAGRTSYGAGRYLLDTVKGADLGRDGDALVIDLNFGYNPSCAYDPAWACPLAPAGNRLEVDIPVGELVPVG